MFNSVGTVLAQRGFIDIDTQYNRVQIFDFMHKKTNQIAKGMIFSPYGTQSAMFLDSEELVFDYTKFYRLGDYFNRNIKNSLMIGGAGYSYPKDFLSKHKEANIDVVEIDPKLTELARTYFKLKENSRLNIYHEDARIFLNKNQKRYDTIYIDAFTAHASIPYHLTTKESIEKIYNSLNKGGVVLVNIIGSLDGDNSRFLKTEYKTYKSIFPQVYLFTVKGLKDKEIIQNIMLIAMRADEEIIFDKQNEKYGKYLNNILEVNMETDLPVLTDDFAPVDYYTINLTSKI